MKRSDAILVPVMVCLAAAIIVGYVMTKVVGEDVPQEVIDARALCNAYAPTLDLTGDYKVTEGLVGKVVFLDAHGHGKGFLVMFNNQERTAVVTPPGKNPVVVPWN